MSQEQRSDDLVLLWLGFMGGFAVAWLLFKSLLR
jgi:hypothetical protein